MTFRLKRNGENIEVWHGDNSEASCGENRTNWTKLKVFTLRSLAIAVLDLTMGKIERVDL